MAQAPQATAINYWICQAGDLHVELLDDAGAVIATFMLDTEAAVVFLSNTGIRLKSWVDGASRQPAGHC